MAICLLKEEMKLLKTSNGKVKFLYELVLVKFGKKQISILGVTTYDYKLT